MTEKDISKDPNLEVDQQNEDDEDHSRALKSISPWRIAIAVVVGLSVIVYLFIREFNLEEFQKIQWNSNVLFWVGMAFVFVCTRHFSYMYRLRIVTNKFFSWQKCLELILVWEFSSAVTPTSVGGSTVALVALSQEKLPPGRTTMIVFYTVILDTFFYLSSLFILFLIFGSIQILPGMHSLSALAASGWGTTFFIAYFFMLSYAFLFFYGVFLSTKTVQRFLRWLTSFRWTKRWRAGAEKMSVDMDSASSELKAMPWHFHLRSYLATAGAWTSRFMVLNCLIMAFIASSNNPIVQEHYNEILEGSMGLGELAQQIFIVGRQIAMYIIMALIPTPGGAGAAESSFQYFHADYLPASGTLLLIMTVFWRFFTYYIYLFIGMIVVPNWIRKLINRRKRERAEAKIEIIAETHFPINEQEKE